MTDTTDVLMTLKSCGSPSPERVRKILVARMMAATAKAWQLKTCLQCGARVAVDPAGNIPEGGMPCGH